MSKNNVTYKLGELFCGPGGFALGAKEASVENNGATYQIEHTWATDHDLSSCETFRRNICPHAPDKVICTDVKKLDLARLKKVNAFAYGFPCNDFSVVGEKKGLKGHFGPLYMYGVKVLDLFRPDWFFAENVGGLRSTDEGRLFTRILHDLRNAGPQYRLTTHLYKFEDYGVPQNRHRIIIIGIKRKLGLEYKIPAPTHLNKHVAVKRVLEDIPADTPNQEITRQSQTVIERLKCIKPGENAWNANIPNELRLNVKSARLSQIYRRLDPNRPSYTITGSGGGGTHGYHWQENRALTNRERARIQTFPDFFVFEGTKESVRCQIGMAIPPLAARVILEAVLKTMAGIEYPYIESKWDEKRKEKIELSELFG